MAGRLHRGRQGGSAMTFSNKMKHFFKLVFVLVMGALWGSPVQAGQWALEGYTVSRQSQGLSMYFENNKRTQYTPRSHTDAPYIAQPATSWSGEGKIERGAYLDIGGSNSTIPSGAKSFITITAAPMFRWQGGGEPTKSFYYRERCHISVAMQHLGRDLGTDSYSFPSTWNAGKLYEGSHFTFSTTNPWKHTLTKWGHTEPYAGNYSYPDYVIYGNDSWRLQPATPNGDTFNGPTRTIKVEVSVANELSTRSTGEGLSASVFANYRAEVTPFSLDLQVGRIATVTDDPRTKHYVAADSFCINPTAIQESSLWDSEWFAEEWILETSLFPLGYSGSPEYCIAVDIMGRVWGLGCGYHLIGNSFDEALEGLISGSKPQEFEVTNLQVKEAIASRVVGDYLPLIF